MSARGDLTCRNHGDRTAGQVCGECGDPLCDDCSNRVTDVTLDDYRPGGTTRLVVGLLLIAGSVALLDALPRALWLTLASLAGKPLYMRLGLEPAFLLVGLALLGTLRFRGITGGFDLSGFGVVTRGANARVVCQSCNDGTKRLQRTLSRAFKLLAVVLILYGVYQSIAALFFKWLWVSGVGGAVWVLREDLKLAVLELSG
ncbi:MAG: hypothetical protein ABEJ85_04520 [Haloarculaceae archaeon]